MPLSFILGVCFVCVGVLASSLQYWLWTFPMVPDPGGSDPNGKTSAPLFWRIVHRILGYGFVGLYLWIIALMIPRLSFLGEETTSIGVILHLVFGVVIAPLLVFKVLILRRWQFLGKWLPRVGGLVVGFAVLVVGLVFSPVARLTGLPVANDGDRIAKAYLTRACLSCHGATPILDRGGDDTWSETIEEMGEIAGKSGRGFLSWPEQKDLAVYLDRVLPRRESGGRRRGRDDGD